MSAANGVHILGYIVVGREGQVDIAELTYQSREEAQRQADQRTGTVRRRGLDWSYRVAEIIDPLKTPTVSKSLAALKAIEMMHERYERDMPYRSKQDVCLTCSIADDWVPFPCETVSTIWEAQS